MLKDSLQGIRVVDLTQNFAGPSCTQLLGDLGAEVLKIERPERGDDSRTWILDHTNSQTTSSVFPTMNRNKRSICIDVDAREGQEIVKNLVRISDVFIHSMKPGSTESRGLSYDVLEELNNRLVYCAISAFGEVGPLRYKPGYDPVIQAFSGIMSLTGYEDAEPTRVGVPLIDQSTGLWAAIAILSALYSRTTTGRGMRVHASLLETGVFFMQSAIASYKATGRLPRKMGSGTAYSTPYELFKTSDGAIFIAAGNDRLFVQACKALGCEELANDSRFVTNASRLLNRAALKKAIESITITKTTANLTTLLSAVGTPCTELQNVDQLLAHDQIKALNIITSVPFDGQEIASVDLPISSNLQRSSRRYPPPRLGQNTAEILLELGFVNAEIERLSREKVVSTNCSEES